MKFEKHFPAPQLKPYIKHYVVSENEQESEYKVFPSSSLVIGFQYRGKLASLRNNTTTELHSSGVSGITDGFKIFKNGLDISEGINT